MSQGKGSTEAAGALKQAMAAPLKAVAATVAHIRDAQAELRAAEDVVDMMKAVATLTLACEALKTAASGGEKVGRAALAQAFDATGVPAIQIEGFTVSLVNAKQDVLITDEDKVPAHYWVQPPQPPRAIDKTAIGKDLKGKTPIAVPGAMLTNGGAPSIQFRKRDA